MNNTGIKSYSKEFKELLKVVFESRAHFSDFFVGNTIEALDGVQHNKTAFSIKQSDIPVVIGTYNTDANVGMGTGTSNSNRFGERKEIIYTDVDVPYTWGWAIHEGLDRATVNNDMEDAVADRLDLQAQAKTNKFDKQHGAFISSVASKTLALADYTPDNVTKLFNAMSKHLNNEGAVGTRVAKVNSDLYNAIVDHPMTTTAKNSSTNIDENAVMKFKGFEIEEVPDALFVSGEIAYAYIKNIAKAFTGINTTRTIESEDFDGLALQGEGKAGEFIIEPNKKAVIKVTGTPTI